MNTKLVTKDILFENEQIEYIVNEHGEVWFSAETIGRALEYKNPSVSIGVIYNRNEELLKKYTQLIALYHDDKTNTDGSTRIRVFNHKGVYLICMKSTMPRAVKFQIAVANLLDDIRKQEKVIVSKDQLELLKLKVREKELTAEIVRLENNKLQWEKEKTFSTLLMDYSKEYPKEISAESQQALHASAILALNPSNEIREIVKTSLPTIQKEYTATDIKNILWKEYKIEKTALEIGKVAKELKIKEDPELCRTVPLVLHNEEGDTCEKTQYKYNEYAKDMILRYYAKGLTTLIKEW
ncbi:MAG: Bro-N domain-containing protein [Methanosarcinales archaeon]